MDIQRYEEALGIATNSSRLVEAGLVIDRKFLETAVITEWPPKPERIFGHREWLGHLAVRQCAQQYGDQPLTIDFILTLHQSFLDKAEPGTVTELRDGDGGRGGQFINGRPASITCTTEQIAAINDNPLLEFKAEDPSTPHTGFIHYPYMSRKEIIERLDGMCTAYNSAVLAGQDPYATAASIQRDFVSLHPLSGDYCGRISRAIMNWSLENAGERPSIVDDVDGDILLPKDAWIQSVRQGSERYAERQRRAEIGETDPVALLGQQAEKVRYNELTRNSGIILPTWSPDFWHKHPPFEEFLATLRDPAAYGKDSRS